MRLAGDDHAVGELLPADLAPRCRRIGCGLAGVAARRRRARRPPATGSLEPDASACRARCAVRAAAAPSTRHLGDAAAPCRSRLSRSRSSRGDARAAGRGPSSRLPRDRVVEVEVVVADVVAGGRRGPGRRGRRRVGRRRTARLAVDSSAHGRDRVAGPAGLVGHRSPRITSDTGPDRSVARRSTPPGRITLFGPEGRARAEDDACPCS